MKIQEKPDYLIFAESAKKGEVSDFPDVCRGWGITIEQTASKPPMEWMNGAFNRVDKNILYLLQQGVPEWSENVKYPANAIIKYNGVLYTSIAENENSKPATNTTKWKKTQAEIANASASQAGIVKLSSAVDSESETVAATSLAVKKTYDCAVAAQNTANWVNSKTDNAQNTANDAHSRINEITDKFTSGGVESRVYSHDKRYYLLVRNDGVVGMYSSVDRKLPWGFDASGTLGEGFVPANRVLNLDQYIRNFTLPAGIPLPWPQDRPPAGWFECNGAQFDVNQFPLLAAAYPDGRLPDLRGEFIRGWDNARGADPHRVMLSWQGDAIRNIVGSTKFNEMIFGLDANGANYISESIKVPSTHHNKGEGWTQRVTFDASRVVPVSHDNHPRNVAFMYIVKAE